ncbi:MAG: glycoside hydrolase family 88 protein [Lysobacterales bacterium]
MHKTSKLRSQMAILTSAFLLAGGSLANENPVITDGVAPDAGFCVSALNAAELQLDGFRKAYPDPTKIARSYEKGQAKMVETRDWTSGFVAGSFWYMYEFTKDPDWLASAEKWTAALESQKNNTRTHDVGFIMFNSYGNGLRLTGNESFEPILIQTADSLMTRYNPNVGATRSWDFGEWSFPVIIDNMMNLELLYAASQMSGDNTYADAATSHATTTMNNHFRPDNSSFHVVDYDPESGKAIHKQTHQGIRDDSAWARGQAWGLYGYTVVYRFTRDEKFLKQAEKIAGFYLNHPNMPEDKVPYFDFDVADDPDIENYRDSSAAAVAASGLLELATYVSEPQSKVYRKAALAMLSSLASPAYSAEPGSNGHFLLKHATGRWQADDEVDAALNYGDYYYLEGLLRCKNLD